VLLRGHHTGGAAPIDREQAAPPYPLHRLSLGIGITPQPEWHHLPRDWTHLGAVVPGFPFLHPLDEDFWEQFWKLYQQQREAAPES